MFQTQVEWKKKQLNLTNELLSTAYVMVVQKKSANEISKALKTLTIDFNKKELEKAKVEDKEKQKKKDEELKNYYMMFLPNISKKTISEITMNTSIINGSFLIKKVVKITKKVDPKEPIEKIIQDITKGIQREFPKIIQVINQVDRKIKEKFKEKSLDKLMAKYPFAIASAHGDSALDHKDYQSKLYYNTRFKNNKQVMQLVNTWGMDSIQWVTGKPVYFVTRPNCRHYFEGVTLDEALNGTYTIPTRAIGNSLYKNPGGNQQFYEQRLKLFEEMYKKHPTNDLRILINKTRIIVQRWKVVNKYGK